MNSVIGWLGSFLLSFCGIAEVFVSLKTKRCNLSYYFLTMWGLGEVLLFFYVLPQKDLPLILNYSVNLIFILILFYYKLFGAKK